MYEKLKAAHEHSEPVPDLIVPLHNDEDVPQNLDWASEFEETTVHIEHVIAYWSRMLKPAERNYSPTEREALALCDGLVKFQPYIEGEKITAITDHAALVWSRTFQNVNRRLLTWGTVFAAYPDLKIVHRAGRVHSNVDPISRLRRNIPFQDGPLTDSSALAILEPGQESLTNLYEEIHPQFEARTLRLAAEFEEQNSIIEPSTFNTAVNLELSTGQELTMDYNTSRNFNLVASLASTELKLFAQGYSADPYFKKICEGLRTEKNWVNITHPRFLEDEDGLLYFEDWNGNLRLCVPKDQQIRLMAESHNLLTEGAHAGYHRTYNKMAATYYWPQMSRHVKRYVNSCDIYQKSKPRRHAPRGYLQSLPIPERPFEIITMDFITELPLSDGYDSILVIVDKLTKYAIFIPVTIRFFIKHQQPSSHHKSLSPRSRSRLACHHTDRSRPFASQVTPSHSYPAMTSLPWCRTICHTPPCHSNLPCDLCGLTKLPSAPYSSQLRYQAHLQSQASASYGGTTQTLYHGTWAHHGGLACTRVEPRHKLPPIGSTILLSASSDYLSPLGRPWLCLRLSIPFLYFTPLYCSRESHCMYDCSPPICLLYL